MVSSSSSTTASQTRTLAEIVSPVKMVMVKVKEKKMERRGQPEDGRDGRVKGQGER